jgi:hypothetical protein
MSQMAYGCISIVLLRLEQAGKIAIDSRTSVQYTYYMHTHIVPDRITKLTQMGDTTRFEPSGDQPLAERRVPYQSRSLAECITNVVTPKGKKPILKTVKHPSPSCKRMGL